MRVRRIPAWLLYLSLAVLLGGCTEVEKVRFGLVVMYLYAVPLLGIGSLATLVGVVTRGVWRTAALMIVTTTAIACGVVVAFGFSIVADGGHTTRVQVLDHLAGLLVIELLLVVMTAHLSQPVSPTWLPAADELSSEELLPLRRRNPMPWVVGIYLALCAVGVAILMVT